MSGYSNARYGRYLCDCPDIGLALDYSHMSFADDFIEKMEPEIQRAFQSMCELENGAIANPDEDRMVGHYWLRAPKLAPTPEITQAIEQTLRHIKEFTNDVHKGIIRPQRADRFTDLLVIGIGGSALGPQWVADALGDPVQDRFKVHFIDNTDPDGIDRTLRRIGSNLCSTLTLVITKSGSTPETRNGMLLAADAFRKLGLDFAQHAVAVTAEGSQLDELATEESWLARFPMWDWIGGRTSELSAVGLLPAALQGIEIDALLRGAAACDEITRSNETTKNPAALLALMWHCATGGRGEKDMVILPYKDRLLLLSRYLQQLIMESLGKGTDLHGNPCEQGLTVYGNKGSTDQHALVQQLREGVNNFFVLFIRVLEEGGGGHEIEPGVTAGDYLNGFLLGTRLALSEKGRSSMTLTIQRVDAYHIGVLIALFERAVGFYASLIHVNAYHQPGVEAGKKAAAALLDLQRKILDRLAQSDTVPTVEQLAKDFKAPEQVEQIHHILQHLKANGRMA